MEKKGEKRGKIAESHAFFETKLKGELKGKRVEKTGKVQVHKKNREHTERILPRRQKRPMAMHTLTITWLRLMVEDQNRRPALARSRRVVSFRRTPVP